MATIQAKTSNGHKYWYVVESRRINKKPRPVVLAYLGKIENLLKRFRNPSEAFKVKSYAHGAVSAILSVAHKLDIPPIINKYVKSSRAHVTEKPIRNNLTVGMTILLAALGRVCLPVSKRSWADWVKTTSCEYLLRANYQKLDSQHFWDMMDSLPTKEIENIERDILQKVMKVYQIRTDSLFFDATNFFTFINSTNQKCTIAQRGKNKQGRHNLRQVGLALVVNREDLLPLFHFSYQGNTADVNVFKDVLRKIVQRFEDLKLDITQHTLIFDRGNNSKESLKLVKEMNLFYVGALTPYHHKNLITEADGNFQEVVVNKNKIQAYRAKKMIWGEERTVIVLISEKLRKGQLRGIYQGLKKRREELRKLQQNISNPKAKKQTKEVLEKKIGDIIKGQFMKGLITWSLQEKSPGRFALSFFIEEENIQKLEEDKLGFRILMTNRHSWETVDIIQNYHNQATIEKSFKIIKNPYHLAVRPSFHWTDQKIQVHYFICILAYLLAMLTWKEAKKKANFTGDPNILFSKLNKIRLSTLVEKSSKKKLKATYVLEEMENDEKKLMKALNIETLHENPLQINGVGVYS